jgi:hypothetical protein
MKCRVVSGLECLADEQRDIRYLLRVGRGHKAQIWVLERLRQNRQTPFLIRDFFDALYFLYKLFYLGFSILLLCFLSIVERSSSCLCVLSRPLRRWRFRLLRKS